MNRSPKLRRHARGDILFGPLFFIGFVAAIALPAYQDYTIRSQVAEGLALASPAKAAVAEFYATNGRWPVNNQEAGLEGALSGQYTSSVTISKGTLTIRYGAHAYPSIVGHRLTLRPVIGPEDTVVWNCGFGEIMGGSDPKTGAAPRYKTNIAPRHLPRVCRS